MIGLPAGTRIWLAAGVTDMCNGSRLKTGMLAFDAVLGLELTGNDQVAALTLSANELAFVGAGSHSIVACSR